jgi:predicted transposase/invertase (TIGR01784 family)
MYFLKAPQELPQEFLEIEEVNKAMNTLTYVSQDPKLRRIYNERLKAQNDAINEISHAKNVGRKEGRLEAALSMLKNGLSVELVSKCTGLSEEEIRELL